jgi:hypothetical protein
VRLVEFPSHFMDKEDESREVKALALDPLCSKGWI